MTLAGLPFVRPPRLHGIAAVVALGAIVGVPLLSAFFPRSAARLAVPLLAITSVGIFLTVPDTERVSLVMAVMLVAAVVCLASEITPNQWAIAATALVVIGVAILDSAGRGAAIVRATGCFGVLLAAPLAEWLNRLRTNAELERRSNTIVLVVAHCLVVGFASRALIRETSMTLVVPAVGGALFLTAVLLFAVSRPAATEP
ncbi:MAG: hypothetical protein QOI95_3216 [Acidimicrobiaceae bacterium]